MDIEIDKDENSCLLLALFCFGIVGGLFAQQDSSEQVGVWTQRTVEV